jgi:hypothetical protein
VSDSNSTVIIIEPDGVLRCLGDDPILAHVGEAETRRASHVVPLARLPRLAFIAIRSVVSDHGSVAAWCRLWRGPWIADLSPVNGPTLGPFTDRAAALDAERGWLVTNHWKD